MPPMDNLSNTSEKGAPALRRDAARNVQRILDTGREILRENPQASAEDIARAAGLGVATLYRRFPTREDLIRGVVEEIVAKDVAPVLAKAEREADPREGVRIAFEVGLRSALHEGITLPSGITLNILRSYLDPVSRMISRGQQQGLMRADLDPEKDTLRIFLMLLSVLPTFSHGSEGWQRYLRLVMDSLLPMPGADPLPPAEAVVDPYRA